MARKFPGSIDDLKALVASGGLVGEWSAEASGKQTFRGQDGCVLNFWPKTGSVQIQGSGRAHELSLLLDGPVAGPLSPSPERGRGPQRERHIFIVHGHDHVSRDQLELALRRLGLEPFVLMNSSGRGKTLIEALEGAIGRDYSSDFGIVLMTPDDMGYAKNDGADKAEPRARQNVVLETGMLLSSLTRERMAIVVKGHLKLPSDLEGIIRFPFNDHVRETVSKLAQRLQEAGFKIRSDQIASALQ